MSVVKGFTELMQRTLQVESDLGKGSTFIVEIPFDEPFIRERELVMSSKEEQDQVSEELKGKKVLLKSMKIHKNEVFYIQKRILYNKHKNI